ncbi:hypothetical protein HPB48_005695 [Haemaphysalis longicornis]|uniref:Uncharacterized protein n=1 Tax=Haemaphysalis longicornis TaxID=44386 RepID=A0A9J6GYW2_HAELO|nr:hypothetical protein HPB48_005695 [Haemaphysalis longicornis]
MLDRRGVIMHPAAERIAMSHTPFFSRRPDCRVNQMGVDYSKDQKDRQDPQPKDNNVVVGFFVIARFHRILGYSFVTRNSENGKPRSKILSPYLLYAIVSWIVYVFVIGSDINRVLTLLEDQRNRVIDRAIQILGNARCLGIEISAVLLILTKSEEFVELVEYLVELERRIRRTAPLKRAAITVLCLNVLFSITSVLSISAEIYDFDEYSHAAYMKILYGLFSVVFAENVCMISFSWLMFFSLAFSGCLSRINEDITRMSTEVVVNMRELGELHRLFSDVGGAFARLEHLLGVAILICFPLNIVNAAPWGYYMLKADKGTTIFMLDLIGFLTICAEMFAAGVYTRATKQEVRMMLELEFLSLSTR